MSALKGRAIEEFLRSPPQTGAVLVYGPDLGLVRERADALARTVVSDLKDAFNAIELGDADLKAEPGRLADEAAALSFAGGRRVVRYRAPGEAAPQAVAALVAALDSGTVQSNALVIVEGGDLSARSALRVLFEKSKTAAALPCYADEPDALRALALSMAQAEDLRFDDDALLFLVSLLGEDRGVSRSEIEKLILFKGLKAQREGPAAIALDDVRACLVDGAGEAIDDAAAAAADGAAPALSRALAKSAAAGGSPISLIRALLRQLARLAEAQRAIRDGASLQDAMRRLRPPVYFEQRAFEARLRIWPPARIEAALDLLIEAEIAAKTTGAPQREIAERAAFAIAAMARR